NRRRKGVVVLLVPGSSKDLRRNDGPNPGSALERVHQDDHRPVRQTTASTGPPRRSGTLSQIQTRPQETAPQARALPQRRPHLDRQTARPTTNEKMTPWKPCPDGVPARRRMVGVLRLAATPSGSGRAMRSDPGVAPEYRGNPRLKAGTPFGVLP